MLNVWIIPKGVNENSFEDQLKELQSKLSQVKMKAG